MQFTPAQLTKLLEVLSNIGTAMAKAPTEATASASAPHGMTEDAAAAAEFAKQFGPDSDEAAGMVRPAASQPHKRQPTTDIKPLRADKQADSLQSEDFLALEKMLQAVQAARRSNQGVFGALFQAAADAFHNATTGGSGDGLGEGDDGDSTGSDDGLHASLASSAVFGSATNVVSDLDAEDRLATMMLRGSPTASDGEGSDGGGLASLGASSAMFHSVADGTQFFSVRSLAGLNPGLTGVPSTTAYGGGSTAASSMFGTTASGLLGASSTFGDGDAFFDCHDGRASTSNLGQFRQQQSLHMPTQRARLAESWYHTQITRTVFACSCLTLDTRIRAAASDIRARTAIALRLKVRIVKATVSVLAAAPWHTAAPLAKASTHPYATGTPEIRRPDSDYLELLMSETLVVCLQSSVQTTVDTSIRKLSLGEYRAEPTAPSATATTFTGTNVLHIASRTAGAPQARCSVQLRNDKKASKRGARRRRGSVNSAGEGTPQQPPTFVAVELEPLELDWSLERMLLWQRRFAKASGAANPAAAAVLEAVAQAVEQAISDADVAGSLATGGTDAEEDRGAEFNPFGAAASSGDGARSELRYVAAGAGAHRLAALRQGRSSGASVATDPVFHNSPVRRSRQSHRQVASDGGHSVGGRSVYSRGSHRDPAAKLLKDLVSTLREPSEAEGDSAAAHRPATFMLSIDACHVQAAIALPGTVLRSLCPSVLASLAHNIAACLIFVHSL